VLFASQEKNAHPEMRKLAEGMVGMSGLEAEAVAKEAGKGAAGLIPIIPETLADQIRFVSHLFFSIFFL
jgi:hypothetical protein